jgi:hypothetical protein
MSHCVVPCQILTIPHESQNYTYKLASIVYFDDIHFCTHIIGDDGKLWIYDRQLNGGQPFLDIHGTLDCLPELQKLGSKNAYIYVYKLQN